MSGSYGTIKAVQAGEPTYDIDVEVHGSLSAYSTTRYESSLEPIPPTRVEIIEKVIREYNVAPAWRLLDFSELARAIEDALP